MTARGSWKRLATMSRVSRQVIASQRHPSGSSTWDSRIDILPVVSLNQCPVAQRFFHFASSAQVLVSSSVADVLIQLTEWKDLLRDLGVATVKHDIRIRVFNLCTENAGNAELPKKLRVGVKRKRIETKGAKRRWLLFIIGAVVIMLVLIAVFLR